MKLRVRCPSQPQPIPVDVPEDVPLSLLPTLLEEAVGIIASRMHISGGFPPKAIELDDALVGSKIRAGDMLIVKEGEGTVKRGHTDGRYIPPCDVRGAVMVRREVPADNSCCFHAIAKVMDDGSTAATLRARIAEIVIMHPAKFNAVYLGMPPAEYASWISHPDTWGGAIEIQIMTFLFQTELVVVDVSAKRTEVFGQGEGYVTRAFLYYTGKHYDALAVTSAAGESRRDQFLFSSRDDGPMKMAADIAKRGAA